MDRACEPAISAIGDHEFLEINVGEWVLENERDSRYLSKGWWWCIISGEV